MLSMSHPRRFLFLYSRTGGGHLATARAVADALDARYGDDVVVDMADIFVESGVWPFVRFPEWYPTMLGLRAWPWRLVYHLTDHRSLVTGLSRLLWPYVRNPVRRLMTAHPHDAIVSFHPIPNDILSRYRARHAPNTPLVVVVQDFVNAPAAWFAPGFDAYFLPWDETKVRARALGLPADRLHVTGLPVRRAFLAARQKSKLQVRFELGLKASSPVVLFVGGGDGAGEMFSFVQALLAREPAAQIVVIAGRNRTLQARLQAVGATSRLHLLGFREDMPLWMRAADILVTKAGPNSLAEAFMMGLPTVIYHAIPGQEAGSPGLVAARGAGVWAPKPAWAADAVLRLLQDEVERTRMAAAARSLAHPRAAVDIAESLWRMTAYSNPAIFHTRPSFP